MNLEKSIAAIRFGLAAIFSTVSVGCVAPDTSPWQARQQGYATGRIIQGAIFSQTGGSYYNSGANGFINSVAYELPGILASQAEAAAQRRGTFEQTVHTENGRVTRTTGYGRRTTPFPASAPIPR